MAAMPDLIPRAVLDDAVARGVIDAEQRARLVALAEERRARDGAPAAAHPWTWIGERLGGTGILYGAGAAAVLFAMGWFLADRWRALGDAGVLAVVAGYALVFVVAAGVLRREGFRVAGALALLLAVATTPIATWAALRLAGFWPELPGACRWDSEAILYCRQGWIVVELATILAALVALRAVRVGPLTAPIGVAALFLVQHGVEAARGTRSAGLVVAWGLVLGASLLATAAYTVDRRTAREGEDYGMPLWIAAVAAAAFGAPAIWRELGAARHVLPAVGFVLAVSGLSLCRRIVLLAGAACFLWYLGWLSFEVFRDVLAFPLALGMAGLAVIVATALAQRHFPALVARLRLPEGERRMPGGHLALLAPAFLALLMFADAAARDRDRAETERVRQMVWRRRAHRENAAARARRAAAGIPEPVKARPATVRPAPR